MSTKDVYIAEMKHQLDDLNARLTQIELNAKAAQSDMRVKYQEEMAKLKEQSMHASAKLNELKAVGVDSWEKMSLEMDKVRDAFKHSFAYFKSQV